MLLKSKLGQAPIENPQSVLDIGTGTGIWAIDYGKSNRFTQSEISPAAGLHEVLTAIQHPAADVLGTDLSPIQPE
jgi:methylase of polypeptide subunit release factors